MYKLYASPGACSLAVHTLLVELNQPFELINVKEGDHRQALLAVNSRGQVPTLTEGNFALREGAAILVYLCDTYKSPLLPTSGHARARALEWLMFGNATLHPAYSRGFGAPRNFSGEALTQVMDVVVRQINSLWKDVESHLIQATTPYLCGNDCTIGDILLTVIGNWSPAFAGIEIGAQTRALFARVSKRPAFAQALAKEHVTYTMAA